MKLFLFTVISGIIGCYQIDIAHYGPKEQNRYHLVNITWNRGTSDFTWKNKAGASCILTPIFIDGKFDTTRLAVGLDCPWYKDTYKFATLKWDGVPGSSNVTNIGGPLNEVFQRYPSCSYTSKGMHFKLSAMS